MNLVIAEKPSVAQSIAKVLRAGKKDDGFVEGNGYVVSWCVGHLVELAEPEHYDERYERWKKEYLPIVPEKWEYQVASGTRKQFQILKKLMKREDTIKIREHLSKKNVIIGAVAGMAVVGGIIALIVNIRGIQKS